MGTWGELMKSEGTSRAILLCSFYGIMSIWCVLSNKWILLLFPSSNLLLLFQSLVTVIILIALKAVNLIDAPSIGLTIPWHHRGELVVSVLYLINVVFGLWSLNYLTVPMYGAIKRTNLVVSLFGEAVILKSPGTNSCVTPVIVMMLGTLIASLFDLQFSSLGLIFGIISSGGQGISLVYSKLYSVQEGKANLWGILYLNSLLTILALGILTTATGELESLVHFDKNNKWLQTHLVINGVSIMFLNLSMFLNANLNSPLTVSVTGNVKVIGTTIFGIILFQQPISFLGGVGLITNFVGAAGYTFVKYQQRFGAKKQPPVANGGDAPPSPHSVQHTPHTAGETPTRAGGKEHTFSV